MLELLFAEALDGVVQFLFLRYLGERRGLLGVVLADYFLGCNRTGHGRALADERGRRAERETGDVPDRLQDRGANAPFREHLVERAQMLEFLLQHVAQDRRLLRASEYGKLAFIGPARAKIRRA